MKTGNAPLFRRLAVPGTIFFLLIGISVLAGVDFLVEVWWHASLDFLTYYLMRIAYRDVIVVLITLLQGCFIFANFVLIPHLLGFDPARLFAGSSWFNRLSRLLLKPSGKLFAVSAIVFTIPILTPIYLHWEDFLLFLFSAGSGLKDPVFGKDIAFYLFSYPFIQLVQNELLLVFSLLFATVAWIYWVANRQLNDGQLFPRGVKIHLTMLMIAIVAIQAWSIGLERYDILYVDRHEPVYFGPGFVEINFQLPLIWLNFLAFSVTAAAAIYYICSRKGQKFLIACAFVYAGMVAIKHTQWIPDLIDRFYVSPNPVTAERRNMEYHINSTLQAFGLDRVETLDYPIHKTFEKIDSKAISDVLENIPLWDHELLLAGFDQMQAIRPFFGFFDIAVDRYSIEGRNVQVDVAARELRTDKLPQPARNWNNIHFIYTHGFGVAMTPSLQQANEPMQWLIRGLSNRTVYEKLALSQPQVFFGLADYDYAIMPNNARSPELVGDDVQLKTNLTMSRGIDVSSIFKKVVFAGYFGDIDLLLTTNIGKDSRILLRRNILERIKTVAPFLTIDPNPYPVVVDQKIYWIADAYTTSEVYPGVRLFDFPWNGGNGSETQKINFIRNSVKIIIDAYSGAVDFYLIDPTDPIARSYRNIYPTLFKDGEDIPKAFINHLSYPAKLFALQMAVYARYHQTNADIYYQQSEAMNYPEIEGHKVLPYFLTLRLQGGGNHDAADSQFRFVLVAPLAQIGRDNLRMIAMAGCLRAVDCQTVYSADIQVYKFPIDQQIEGPAQMTGFINQDPEISRQLNLWQKRGTQVIRGRMIVVPVAGTVLYVQPVYTVAERSTGFPQLTRIIVAMNQVAAMDSSIEQAFAKLKGKLGF